jgi:hypothetical protein
VTDEELARMASQTVKELVSWSWCHRFKRINCKAPALVQKIMKFREVHCLTNYMHKCEQTFHTPGFLFLYNLDVSDKYINNQP